MITNKYETWCVTDAGSKKIQLPINPPKISVKYDGKNEIFNVVDVGERTILNKNRPEQISFSGIFPAKYFEGCAVQKPLSPMKYVNFFYSCMKDKKPLAFTIAHTGKVGHYTVENFSYSESGGDVGTIEYSITLKHYTEMKIQVIKTVKNSKANARKILAKKKLEARANTKTTPKTYTVKSGDCLWNIAKKFYDSGSEYTKIYNANKKIIGSNPNLIYPGQVLSIP